MSAESFRDKILYNYHRIDVKSRPFFAPLRRLRINNYDFTIISNNCWGGICYEYYGLKKTSPTVGMYFYADDYIKYISNLLYYSNLDMRMISSRESKHYSSLLEKKETDVPIGVLGDIEIVFLHYHDPILAKEKWTKRCKRINWNNIIYKFSYMNECTDQNIDDFLRITEGKKRICFVSKNQWNNYGVYKIPARCDGQIADDTTWFRKYIDLDALINQR